MVMHISKHMNFANTAKEANFLFSHTYMPPKYTLLQINQHSFEYKTKLGRKDWVGFFVKSSKPDTRIYNLTSTHFLGLPIILFETKLFKG